MRMNVSIGHIEKLRKHGFSFPHYENEIRNGIVEKGMVFWYDCEEWIEGGQVFSDQLSLRDVVIKNGVWLPSLEYLLLWLKYNSFSYQLIYTEGRFSVIAEDIILSELYEGANQGTIIDALVKVIKRICQSKKRAYVPVLPKGYKPVGEDGMYTDN